MCKAVNSNSSFSDFQTIMESVSSPSPSPSPSSSCPDEIIRLNVGGTFFWTRKAHLLQSPFFEALLRFPERERSADGSFFVDRNPKVFAVILELFRTGILFWSNDIELRAILIEADYYLISDKVRHALCPVRNGLCKKKKEKKKKSGCDRL